MKGAVRGLALLAAVAASAAFLILALPSSTPAVEQSTFNRKVLSYVQNVPNILGGKGAQRHLLQFEDDGFKAGVGNDEATITVTTDCALYGEPTDTYTTYQLPDQTAVVMTVEVLIKYPTLFGLVVEWTDGKFESVSVSGPGTTSLDFIHRFPAQNNLEQSFRPRIYLSAAEDLGSWDVTPANIPIFKINTYLVPTGPGATPRDTVEGEPATAVPVVVLPEPFPKGHAISKAAVPQALWIDGPPGVSYVQLTVGVLATNKEDASKQVKVESTYKATSTDGLNLYRVGDLTLPDEGNYVVTYYATFLQSNGEPFTVTYPTENIAIDVLDPTLVPIDNDSILPDYFVTATTQWVYCPVVCPFLGGQDATFAKLETPAENKKVAAALYAKNKMTVWLSGYFIGESLGKWAWYDDPAGVFNWNNFPSRRKRAIKFNYEPTLEACLSMDSSNPTPEAPYLVHGLWERSICADPKPCLCKRPPVEQVAETAAT